MNVSRIAILGVAAVAGIGAFVLMMGKSPETGGPIQIVEQSREEMVRVLIAKRDLQRGERLLAEDTDWVDWPQKAVRETYMTDANPEAREELVDSVARTLIVEGEPILEQKVVRAGSSGLMAAILTPGMRAITMRVSPETAAGGFILPGDRIDVLFTEGGRGSTSLTKTIFEDVRVLAVNTIFSENPEMVVIEGVNVTMEFSPTDAESFVTARTTGGLNLSLRSIFKPDGETASSKEQKSTNVTVIRYGRS